MNSKYEVSQNESWQKKNLRKKRWKIFYYIKSTFKFQVN